MSEGVSASAILLGAGLIVVATIAWLASRRWPLAGVIVQFAAAAMATRFAIGGVELVDFGEGGTLAFRVVAGAAALFCLFGGVMQIVSWSRYWGSGADQGEQ